jgi:hypothetical protein
MRTELLAGGCGSFFGGSLFSFVLAYPNRTSIFLERGTKVDAETKNIIRQNNRSDTVPTNNITCRLM